MPLAFQKIIFKLFVHVVFRILRNEVMVAIIIAFGSSLFEMVIIRSLSRDDFFMEV